MSFPKSFLDELKNRIRVSDVVGRKVKLTRRGREFVGLSPFNNEKTPSFTVNDDKQFYHCFSTGEHGDVIKFLEKTENLSFLEAVERLASEAGMEMPRRDPQEAEREQKRTGLIDVMSAAQDYFRESLNRGKGAEARAYLARRGLSDATIENFGIGFAPDDRSGLKSYMMGRGFKIPQMVEGGLLISGEDIREPYDRFRNRIMFPIEDARGRVIAFGGRALDPRAKAKYMNSPETPLFHKGRLLYNLARARKPSYDQGSVIVVEGYMDVVALGQAGINNAVAPLGTALTEEQIGLLWRLAPEPVLCFDGDKAGLRAAYRSVERLLPLLKPGHSARFSLLTSGQDPDDLVREGGRAAMDQVVAAAIPLSEMLGHRLLDNEKIETPDDRARLEAKSEEFLKAISDELVQKHYRRTMRDLLWNFFADKFGWRIKGQPPKRSLVRGLKIGLEEKLDLYPAPGAQFESTLLSMLFVEPDLADFYGDRLILVEFSERLKKRLLDEYMSFTSVDPKRPLEDFATIADEMGLGGMYRAIIASGSYRAALSAAREEEGVEPIFLEAIDHLVALGQYNEVQVDAASLNPDSDDALKAFDERTKWIAKELHRGFLTDYDPEFYKTCEELRVARKRRREARERGVRAA